MLCNFLPFTTGAAPSRRARLERSGLNRGSFTSWRSEARGVLTASHSPASATPGTSYNEHKPKTPPPDLPSLLLDSRIVYIGMPLVPAVTELIVSELLYLQYTDSSKPCYIYINSSGCTRADGEVVGFDTEATAIYDTMKYIGNEVSAIHTAPSGSFKLSNRSTRLELGLQ